MPVTITKAKGGGYQVRTPNMIHSKHATKKNAQAQMRLLQMVEHGGVPRNRKKAH